MEDIDQGEQRRVIDEFTGQGAQSPERGVEWLPSTPSSLTGHGAGNMVPGAGGGSDVSCSPLPAGHPLGGSPPPPFRFLQEAEAEKLVRVLGNERPQTIALVLSHLPPARAGAVLSRLPENVQVDVIHRLVDLEETDPEILREVEETLRSQVLTAGAEMQRRRVAGLQAVAGILKATDGRVGMRILDNLASRDRTLAEKLRDPWWRQLAFR